MTSLRAYAAAVLLIAGGALAGCSDDSSPMGKTSDASPQDDGRELADWATVTFLGKDSTAICEVGSSSLAERFGEQGWCEQDVQFKETPVSLKLIATCDATRTGGKTAPGTLYAYHVDPSISFEGEDDKESGIVVIVDKGSDKWIVNDLYTTSLDPAEPVIGSCPYQGMQTLNQSIPLG